ncbi:16S rRNA (guanine527-N7)-methyltransferase [Sphingomonas jinjuensis]|uniref:Ribosomal RNA small subunit methyltransferase G n=1 Tax=Sphingomonas jinjuensis TaxID=535907 RepID=A0A840EZV3_9SPHN|nr:16S rRNA (guanine(527)-N(7))-methyltransferase RsmG [Sphingomonas jinjuensis]MBB4152543.1 16S rRNA (guanine527-N7)-methyltransferase [Sphingomonas jinjuensis]
MTEEEARAWVADKAGADTMASIERFLAMVTDENDRQNLIAPSTIATIWNRHALDSAQLLALAPAGAVSWLDIGSGGGFPGVIVALMSDAHVTMVEPRRRRAEFLAHAVEVLGLDAVVHHSKIEAVEERFDVISARAVAAVDKLGAIAGHCAHAATRWLLPRGQLDETTLSTLVRKRRVFHVEQSVSDPASSILVVEGVL